MRFRYYGGNRLAEASKKHHYELLYPMLDIATTLDPYFNIAYRFGAIFLSEGYPGGPARPDQAIALLRKGIAARPDRWEYDMDIGFVYYWHLREYRGSGRVDRARLHGAGGARLAGAACRDDAGAGGGPSVGAPAVAARLPGPRKRGCARRRPVRSSSSTRSIKSIGCSRS